MPHRVPWTGWMWTPACPWELARAAQMCSVSVFYFPSSYKSAQVWLYISSPCCLWCWEDIFCVKILSRVGERLVTPTSSRRKSGIVSQDPQAHQVPLTSQFHVLEFILSKHPAMQTKTHKGVLCGVVYQVEKDKLWNFRIQTGLNHVHTVCGCMCLRTENETL